MTALRSRLHRRRPVSVCEYTGHTVSRRAVYRHPGSGAQCPLCAEPITAQPLMNGTYRIPAHERLSNVTTAVVR